MRFLFGEGMKVSAVHSVTMPSGLGANKFQFLKSVKERTLTWWLSVVEIGRAELGLSQLQWAGKRICLLVIVEVTKYLRMLDGQNALRSVVSTWNHLDYGGPDALKAMTGERSCMKVYPLIVVCQATGAVYTEICYGHAMVGSSLAMEVLHITPKSARDTRL